jgi:hypothetical protein
MAQTGLASAILDEVVDFESFIDKLLRIVEIATCNLKDI